jgi:hypothetical protein
MKKACLQCRNQFEVLDEDRVLLDRLSPVVKGRKLSLPEPTHCPDCRQQRRLVWRNERHLYKRGCDLCSKQMVSLYSEGVEFPVYCKECWWSSHSTGSGDGWSGFDYGLDFDFNRSFFEQFGELLRSVPRIGMIHIDCENSDYSQFCSGMKNCYLVNSAVEDEDCLYSHQINWCRDMCDCSFCYDSELCYESIDSRNCYRCSFVQQSERCENSSFLYNCQGLKDCFMCVDLSNKQYCIKNQQYSKEEYHEKVKEFRFTPDSFDRVKDYFEDFKSRFPRKYANLVQCENCVGDYLRNCKDAYHSFDAINVEDGRYIWTSIGCKDSMDSIYIAKDAELSYEGVSVIAGHMLLFTEYCWESSNTFYSSHCFQSNDIFGCVGLKKQKYCILNKQYSKEEYEELVLRIVESMRQPRPPLSLRDISPLSGGEQLIDSALQNQVCEWGEFFPYQLSPYGYNETVASEFYPLSREEVLGKGWNWKDEEWKEYQVQTYIVADLISDVGDDVVGQVLVCWQCQKNYRLIQQELSFYKKLGVPVPVRCHNCRHENRMSLRNKRRLFDRQCGECGKEVVSAYGTGLQVHTQRLGEPLEPAIQVLCEECFLKIMY